MRDQFADLSAVTPISLLVEASRRDSFEMFRDEMARAMLFQEKRRNRAYALGQALRADIPDGLFAEFGVAGGAGCRQFGKILRRHGRTLHGFDSFEGLQEDWTGMQTGREAGAFTQGGELPDIPANVTLHKG